MVILSRIYTRTGDDGHTHLGDMSRTSKTDARLAAYADTDETNSTIGVAIACGDLREDVVATLTRIQNDLFDVGADLCSPLVAEPEFPPCACNRSGSTNSRPMSTATTRRSRRCARSYSRRHARRCLSACLTDRRTAGRAQRVGGDRGVWRPRGARR